MAEASTSAIPTVHDLLNLSEEDHPSQLDSEGALFSPTTHRTPPSSTPAPRFQPRTTPTSPLDLTADNLLSILARPQPLQLDRVLPHLRPLSDFDSPYAFLEDINRTFDMLNVPPTAYPRLLSWALSKTSATLAEWVEEMFRSSPSPSWTEAQARLIDRIEGPDGARKRVEALFALRPLPGQNLEDFGAAFLRAHHRAGIAGDTLSPPQLFAEALPQSHRSAFNSQRLACPTLSLRQLIDQTSFIVGGDPILPVTTLHHMTPPRPSTNLPTRPPLTADPGQPPRGESPEARHQRLEFRRRNGLCLYCGGSNHVIRNCPKAPQRSATSEINLTDVYSPFLPVVSVTIPQQEEPISLLVDTGAADIFVRKEFANDLKLPLEPISPVVVHLATSDRYFTVSHRATITISWQGTTSTMKALIIPGLNYKIVGGMPWLAAVEATIMVNPDGTSIVFPRTNLVNICPVPQLTEEPDRCEAEANLSIRETDTTTSNPGYPITTETEQQPIVKQTCAPNLDSVTHIPNEYADLMAFFDESRIAKTPIARHGFDLEIRLFDENVPLPDSRLYRLSSVESAALKLWLDDMIQRGHVRPASQANCAGGAGVFFVRKKTGELRLCVDYRLLNKLTIPNRFPLPLPDSLLDRVFSSKPKFLTKIDLKSAFNLLRIRPKDVRKTAFKCQFGVYEFLTMPFGLRNAPSAWQRFIESLFPEEMRAHTVIYVDDILIFSPDFASHVKHVRQTLSILIENGLVGSRNKCHFHCQSTDFLGFDLSLTGIRMHRDKIDAVLSWRLPTSRKGFQSFLGFTNFYRRFIPHFATLAQPLYEASTNVNLASQPSTAVIEAFQNIKQAFLSDRVLHAPDFTRPFLCFGDASNSGCGAVLHQSLEPLSEDQWECPDPSTLIPVGFYSRKLTAAETKYDTADKEMLVIRETLLHFRPWLLSSPFPIRFYTDHRNLEDFTLSAKLTARVMRWQQTFADFDLKVIFQPGVRMIVPDALSRKAEFKPSPEEKAARQQAPRLSPDQVVDLNPPNLLLLPMQTLSLEALWQGIKEWTLNNPPPADTKLANGVYVDSFGRTFVPSSCRTSVLRLRHSHPAAGHYGVEKTSSSIKRDFFWPKLTNDVKMFVRSCDSCQRSKIARSAPFGLLQPLPPAHHPWKVVEIDHIVDLPPCKGFDAILTVTDRFTKQSHFIAAHTTDTAKDLAHQFLHQVFKLHGRPDTIVSDRGPMFISKFWGALCKGLGIKLLHSSGHHPQTAGQSERANQSIEQLLRTCILAHQEDWLDLLPFAEFAFNAADSAATNIAPFHALYGYIPTFDLLPSLDTSAPPSAESTAARWNSLRSTIASELAAAAVRMSREANRHRRPAPHYQPGDLVLLRNQHLPSTVPRHKLDAKYIGPFQILRVISAAAVVLSLPDSWHIHPAFHVSMVKPYTQPVDPPLAPPPPSRIKGHLHYEVERVLARRKFRGRIQYLVKWVGYPDHENSWLPAAELDHAKELLAEFLERR